MLRLLTTLFCEVSVSCRKSSQLALVGLCYFVLPWRWLGPVWALAPFQRCFALLARSWSYPFGSLGSVAFLRSVFPCPCLRTCSGWVFCAYCGFCVCCAVVCVELTGLVHLPSLLLFCGFGVLGWAVSCSCLTFACAGAVFTPACTCSPICAARTLAGTCKSA